MTFTMTLPVLVTFVVVRLVSGKWGSWVAPLAAFLAGLSGPCDFTTSQIQAAPVGLLAMLGSFAMFGAGTLVAVTRHRWHVAGIGENSNVQRPEDKP